MVSGICQMKAGFLFNHSCQMLARYKCASCTKLLCEEHAQQVDDHHLCVRCARKGARPNDSADTPADHAARTAAPARSASAPSGRGTGSAFGRSAYYSSPYYYSSMYRGYGSYGDRHHHHSQHDHDDFTEADGMGLGDEGSEGFESDMDAS